MARFGPEGAVMNKEKLEGKLDELKGKAQGAVGRAKEAIGSAAAAGGERMTGEEVLISTPISRSADTSEILTKLASRSSGAEAPG